MLLNIAMQHICHLTWKLEEELHQHLPLSYSPSYLLQLSLAQRVCEKCSKVWGGAAGGKQSYQALIVLPQKNWKQCNVGTRWRQEMHMTVYILMASPSCHCLCPLVKTRNWHLLPQKRARLSVPHLPHFLRPQTCIALRKSGRHARAWA